MREAELLFIKSCRDNKPEKVQAYLTLADDLKIDVNAGLIAPAPASSFGVGDMILL